MTPSFARIAGNSYRQRKMENVEITVTSALHPNMLISHPEIENIPARVLCRQKASRSGKRDTTSFMCVKNAESENGIKFRKMIELIAF